MELAQWLIPILVFLCIAGLVIGVAQLGTERRQLRKRIHSAGGDNPFLAGGGGVDADANSMLWRLARPLARWAAPEGNEERERFRARLMSAGFRAHSAPSVFLSVKVLLTLGLPALLWLGAQLVGWELQGSLLLLAMVISACIGYYAPEMVLSHLVDERQRELFEAFPDAMDLMIVCVEAGLGIDMAIQRAGAELELRSKALAEELALVGTELRIGATREQALRNLARRTGVEEISMFVTMLLQADRFGTSVADSLRVHAEELRLRRQMRAEEAAAKVPLKLLFPLLFFIFPSLVVVVVGPAGIQISRQIVSNFGAN